MRGIRPFLIGIASALSISSYAQATATSPEPSSICRDAAAIAESLSETPTHLLHAIALTESGTYREEAKTRVAWPWTINAEGIGHYFDTKQEAIEHVRTLIRSGIYSIDVGCMQVNLMYHPQAFKNLHEAFDPVTNIAYATSFLTSLKEAHGSWGAAVRRYHSGNEARNTRYRGKVHQEWTALHQAGTAPIDENQSLSQDATQDPNLADASETGETYFGLSHWPPRDYAKQVMAEHYARAVSMSPTLPTASASGSRASPPIALELP